MPHAIDQTGALLANKVTTPRIVTSTFAVGTIHILPELAYAETLELTGNANGRAVPLVAGRDFTPIFLVPGLRSQANQTVCAAVLIKRRLFGNDPHFSTEFQAVGGLATYQIAELLTSFRQNILGGRRLVLARPGPAAVSFANIGSEFALTPFALSAGSALLAAEVKAQQVAEVQAAVASESSGGVPEGGGKPVGGWGMSDLSNTVQNVLTNAGQTATNLGNLGTTVTNQGLTLAQHGQTLTTQAQAIEDLLESVTALEQGGVGGGSEGGTDYSVPIANLQSGKMDKPTVPPGTVLTAGPTTNALNNATGLVGNGVSKAIHAGAVSGFGFSGTGAITFTAGAGVTLLGDTVTTEADSVWTLMQTGANSYRVVHGNGVAQQAQAGGVAASSFSATADTAGRPLVAGDLGKLVRYNSASNANFTIPTDATLGITDATANVQIEFYQMGTGRLDIVADTANGVTLNKWVGYPTPTQFVSQTIHRVGPNTWAVK